MDSVAHLKLMGIQLHSKFFASQTLPTKSVIIPIAYERETKDEIRGNVVAHCDKERGVLAILCSIRKVNIKPNIEFCGDRRGVQCIHNTGENDGHVIVGEVDLLYNMRVLVDHCLHQVEGSGAKGGSGVEDTLEGRTVFFLAGQARLKSYMCHRAVDYNRDGWLVGIGREDNNILVEGDTTTLGS
jgi:hypothetical protein